MQFTSKRLIVAAAASSVCAAVLAFAPASSAATGYTVTPGGAVTGANSGSLTFVDTTSSSKPKLVCTKFTGSGTATKGSHAFVPATYPGMTTGLSPAGSLAKEALTGCTNSTVGNVTVTPTGTWYLGISSTTSTGGKGYLYNVGATVSAASGSCTFTVSNGAVYGAYTNSTGVFAGTTTPGLTIAGVTGSACSLVGIKNGDKAYLSGKVKLSPIQTIK